MGDLTSPSNGAPMGYSRFFAATAGAALLASAGHAGAASSQEALGQMIDQVVARVPACIGLAIGATRGNVRVQRFYGDTGKHVLPKADTEFEIGSITKTLTATLLAFEDQQGTMHIGDPLARYAPPGFRVPNFNGQPIQLAHLAEHTSGLPRLVPNPPSPMEPEQLWRFTGNYQLPRAPGEQFLYSNLGFALLARAMVRRSNATEDQLYSRIISGPLGLHDTSIEMTGDSARGWRRVSEERTAGAGVWARFPGDGRCRSGAFDAQGHGALSRFRAGPSGHPAALAAAGPA